jgi:hypothetical protein
MKKNNYSTHHATDSLPDNNRLNSESNDKEEESTKNDRNNNNNDIVNAFASARDANNMIYEAIRDHQQRENERQVSPLLLYIKFIFII